MLDSTDIELRSTGDFSLATSVSLAASAAFVENLRGVEGGEAKVLELAFPLEGSWSPVGVRVHQHSDRVHATVRANPGGVATGDIRARLDADGVGYVGIAARDEVVARFQQRCPGLRPVLFPSPYEAAARAIIGHRLPVRQAAAVSARIAAEHGVALDMGDRMLHAFPAPARLADLPPMRGLADRKVDQLRALGTAAVDGWLGSTRLRAMDREDALSHLQQLAGIGPFSAELILLRGLGDPDAFPRTERRLHRVMAAAYQLGDEPEFAVLERVAEQWRLYRSWVGLLRRNS